VAAVTIANHGSTAVSGWTLAFTFPGDQKITKRLERHAHPDRRDSIHHQRQL